MANRCGLHNRSKADFESQCPIPNFKHGEGSIVAGKNDAGTSAACSLETIAPLQSDQNNIKESYEAGAVKMLEDIHNVLRKDSSNRRRNETNRFCQAFLVALGAIFLMWPSLLLFDSALHLLSFRVEALQYCSQETTAIGSVARVSLKLVGLAEDARLTNTKSNGKLTLGCLACIGGLLFLLRKTSRRWAVMTHEQRCEVNLLKRELQETIEEGRSRMDGCFHYTRT